MRILAEARPGSFPRRDASELIARRGSFPSPARFARCFLPLVGILSFSLIAAFLARTTLHSAPVVGQPSALTSARRRGNVFITAR